MILQSDFIDLDTPTGVMRTYVHKPTKPGKYPAILFYSEIFQQTGPMERAAKIIASHGYAVLVPEVFNIWIWIIIYITQNISKLFSK